MNIIGIQPDMISMTNRNMFEPGDRLFYEIGYYTRGWMVKYIWNRTGNFKEIKDPINFMNSEDDRLNDPEHLKHHNFMLIKKQ